MKGEARAATKERTESKVGRERTRKLKEEWIIDMRSKVKKEMRLILLEQAKKEIKDKWDKL